VNLQAPSAWKRRCGRYSTAVSAVHWFERYALGVDI
jgi:hypothetical protein